MAAELTIGIDIPLAFWVFDVLGKMIGGLQIDDIGADLCLLGLSFSATTLLLSLFSTAFEIKPQNEELIGQLAGTAAGALLISLIAYMFSLSLIATSSDETFPRLLRLIRDSDWNVRVTVAIGFAVVAIQTVVYVSSVS
jgi:predicted branched-subunit amino acid permease